MRYVSHHEVFKEESASTPVRIVLNSSLRFHGLSLNAILMKGPNLNTTEVSYLSVYINW